MISLVSSPVTVFSVENKTILCPFTISWVEFKRFPVGRRRSSLVAPFNSTRVDQSALHIINLRTFHILNYCSLSLLKWNIYQEEKSGDFTSTYVVRRTRLNDSSRFFSLSHTFLLTSRTSPLLCASSCHTFVVLKWLNYPLIKPTWWSDQTDVPSLCRGRFSFEPLDLVLNCKKSIIPTIATPPPPLVKPIFVLIFVTFVFLSDW